VGALKSKEQEVSFTIQAIDCITCTPVFRRHLWKIDGVLEVKELPITNKIIVVFDDTRLDRHILEQEIIKISQRAGLGEVILHH
jgi:cation transport ATPase